MVPDDIRILILLTFWYNTQNEDELDDLKYLFAHAIGGPQTSPIDVNSGSLSNFIHVMHLFNEYIPSVTSIVSKSLDSIIRNIVDLDIWSGVSILQFQSYTKLLITENIHQYHNASNIDLRYHHDAFIKKITLMNKYSISVDIDSYFFINHIF